MILRAFTILAIPVLCLSLAGCGGDYSYGALNRLSAYPSKIITTHAPSVANYTQVIVDDSEPVTIDDLLLEIKAKHPFDDSTAGIRFRMFNQAMASQPPKNFEELRVYNLTITSDQDFSPSYLAGSVLNDLFAIEYLNTTDGGTSSQGSYAPELWLTNEELYGKSIDDYLNGESYMILHMQLKLKETPTLSSDHTFEITVNARSMKLPKISIQP